MYPPISLSEMCIQLTFRTHITELILFVLSQKNIKLCVKRSLLGRQNVFKINYRFMQVKRIAEEEHSAILSTFIKLNVPFAIKIFVLSILNGRFTQVLNVDCIEVKYSCTDGKHINHPFARKPVGGSDLVILKSACLAAELD